MVVQLCKYTKNHWTVHLKWVNFVVCKVHLWLPRCLCGKESACQCRRLGFNPWVRKIPGRRAWQPTPVFLPGESHGEEPGGLQPLGSQRGRHDRATTTKYTLTMLSAKKQNKNALGRHQFCFKKRCLIFKFLMWRSCMSWGGPGWDHRVAGWDEWTRNQEAPLWLPKGDWPHWLCLCIYMPVSHNELLSIWQAEALSGFIPVFISKPCTWLKTQSII